MRVLPLAAVLLLAACSQPMASTCGPGTCTGCCLADGRCVPGTVIDGCGLGGAACQACGGGQSCTAGVCVTPTRTDGGNGGSIDAGCLLTGCGGGALICNPTTGTCGRRCPSGSDAECPQPGFCDPATNLCGCSPGTHLCNNACVRDDALATCGARCTACPTSANGTATCDGTQCGLDCQQGYRACGDTCARCPAGATATACDGARCVATTCQAGQRVCAGECAACPAADTTACSGNRCVATSCPSGERVCSGACVDVLDEDACGPSCQVCPSPSSNGFRSCDGSRCTVSCYSGYTACGTECSVCPSGVGIAMSGCVGNACVPTSCAAGYRLCNNTCAACPEGGSSYVCSGTSCVATACTAPLTRCGNGCCGPRVLRVDGLAQNAPVGAARLLDGGAVFAWDNTIYSAALRTAELAADGGATTPVSVGNSNAQGLELFVDANGDQHVVYVDRPTSGTARVMHAFRSGSGAWTSEVAHTASSENILEAAGAVAPDGSLRVVYSNYFSPEVLRYLEKNGSTWSAPIDVPGMMGVRPYDFDVAVDGLGVTHVVAPTSSSGVLYSFGTLTTLAAGPNLSSQGNRLPAVTVDAQNVVTAVLVEGPNLVRKRFVNGAWETVTITAALTDSPVDLVFDATGRLHVFFVGCGTTGCGPQYGAHTAAGWVFAPIPDSSGRFRAVEHFAITTLSSGKVVGAASTISEGAFLLVP